MTLALQMCYSWASSEIHPLPVLTHQIQLRVGEYQHHDSCGEGPGVGNYPGAGASDPALHSRAQLIVICLTRTKLCPGIWTPRPLLQYGAVSFVV
jgi:hypothetical protein